MKAAIHRLLQHAMACICVGLATSSWAAPATAFSGDWAGFEFYGYGGWDNGNCQLVWFRERRYQLDPAIGSSTQLHGTYINRLHGRFLRNTNATCKAPYQPKPMGIVANTRAWAVVADGLANGRVSVTAKFDRCFDSGCNDPQLMANTGNWTSTLIHASDSEIQDPVDDFPGSPPLRYFRESVSARIVDRAVVGFDEILKLIRAGDYKRLNDDYISSLLATSDPAGRNALLAALPVVRPLLSEATDGNLIEARYLYRMRLNDKRTIDGDFTYICRSEVTKSGGHGAAIAVLQLEDGRWRIVSLSFF